jgi:hypothetical protein
VALGSVYGGSINSVLRPASGAWTPGAYQQTTGGSGSNQPVLNLSPQTLAFQATVGGSAPASQTVALSNSGSAEAVDWTQSDNATWLQAGPASGTTPATLTVSVVPSGLTAGTYTAGIVVSAPDAENSPQTITVTLTVSAAPAVNGRFDMTYANRAQCLAAGWDFLARTADGTTRNTEVTSGALVSYDQSLHPGVICIPADQGDLWANADNNTRNTLFRDLPEDWTSIRMKLSSFRPTQNSQQAGLAAYQDDDNYVEVYRIYENANYIGMIVERDQNASVVRFDSQSATNNMFFRLDRNATDEGIEGLYSLDGTNWSSLGRVTSRLTNPRLAIVVSASPSGLPYADIAWAEVYAPSSVSRVPMSPRNLRVIELR